MKTIGGLFGRSPYGPVHEMMMKVNQSVEEMPALLAAHAAGDWDRMAEAAGRIDRLEGQADDIKKGIRTHLSTSLFSSVERTETLSLVHSLDEIADACQDAGKLLTMRRTPLPPEVAGEVKELGAKLVRAAAQLSDVTAKLSGGSANGDAGGIDVHQMITELEAVGRIEFECDEKQQEILKRILALEGRLGPMDVFFLMHIIKELGAIADQTENAAEGLAQVLGSR
jgi:predicted phosphate transport protein (TIGR00153 family)